MKIIYLTVAAVYLLGMVIAFLLLMKDVNKAYKYDTKFDLFMSTLTNTWKFWLRSWEAVFWILLKRKTDGRN